MVRVGQSTREGLARRLSPCTRDSRPQRRLEMRAAMVAAAETGVKLQRGLHQAAPARRLPFSQRRLRDHHRRRRRISRPLVLTQLALNEPSSSPSSLTTTATTTAAQRERRKPTPLTLPLKEPIATSLSSATGQTPCPLKPLPKEPASSSSSASAATVATKRERRKPTPLKLPPKELTASSSSWPFQPLRSPLVPTRKEENRSSDSEGPLAPGRERATGRSVRMAGQQVVRPGKVRGAEKLWLRGGRRSGSEEGEGSRELGEEMDVGRETEGAGRIGKRLLILVYPRVSALSGGA